MKFVSRFMNCCLLKKGEWPLFIWFLWPSVFLCGWYSCPKEWLLSKTIDTLPVILNFRLPNHPRILYNRAFQKGFSFAGRWLTADSLKEQMLWQAWKSHLYRRRQVKRHLEPWQSPQLINTLCLKYSLRLFHMDYQFRMLKYKNRPSLESWNTW